MQKPQALVQPLGLDVGQRRVAWGGRKNKAFGNFVESLAQLGRGATTSSGTAKSPEVGAEKYGNVQSIATWSDSACHPIPYVDNYSHMFLHPLSDEKVVFGIFCLKKRPHVAQPSRRHSVSQN